MCGLGAIILIVTDMPAASDSTNSLVCALHTRSIPPDCPPPPKLLPHHTSREQCLNASQGKHTHDIDHVSCINVGAIYG